MTQQRLAAAIACLTEDQRQVILMKLFEGLANETVARTLGKSVGSVKALQHRGLAADASANQDADTDRDA
ncbi:MAG: hypothetical protein ISS49_07445 [Anaerolineae bacterium]|nr:hypothetical protein [Anaerolineae bacterium]